MHVRSPSFRLRCCSHWKIQTRRKSSRNIHYITCCLKHQSTQRRIQDHCQTKRQNKSWGPSSKISESSFRTRNKSHRCWPGTHCKYRHGRLLFMMVHDYFYWFSALDTEKQMRKYQAKAKELHTKTVCRCLLCTADLTSKTLLFAVFGTSLNSNSHKQPTDSKCNNLSHGRYHRLG